MTTLLQIIEAHEAARAAEHAKRLAASAKGIAVVALYQLRRALLDMGAADRGEVVGMLVELVNEQNARAWGDFRTTLTPTQEV